MKIELKKEIITMTSAVEILKANVGKICTIVFKKQNGINRKCNGQFKNQISSLGYYPFIENKKGYKQFDPKELKEVRINKTVYQIKK